MTEETKIGPFDQTWFCNPDSFDIRRIKPYAAYEIGADVWVVKPPHLPHWSLSELPKPVQQVLRAADSYARHVLKLPEPERTQQGAALFEAWHSDRSRAFSDRGEGWWDIANLREKWLDQAGVWAELVKCAHRAGEGLDRASEDWSNIPTGYLALRTAAFEWDELWCTARDAEPPCTACSGTGEQGTGHECYQCDGTGLHSEQDPAIDNANPENGLSVGRDDGKGIKPVTAATDKTGYTASVEDGRHMAPSTGEPMEGYEVARHARQMVSGLAEHYQVPVPDVRSTGSLVPWMRGRLGRYRFPTGGNNGEIHVNHERIHRGNIDSVVTHEFTHHLDLHTGHISSDDAEAGHGPEFMKRWRDVEATHHALARSHEAGEEQQHTAATDKWPPYLTEREDGQGDSYPVNISRSNPRGPVGTEADARAAGLVGPFFHGTHRKRAQEIRRGGFRQPRLHNWEMANAGTAEEVNFGHTHRTFFAETHDDAMHFARAHHGDQADVVKTYIHPDHIERDSGGGWMPSVQVRDVTHAMAISDRSPQRTAARREPVDMARYFAGSVKDLHSTPWRLQDKHIALDPQTWASLPVEDVPTTGNYATQGKVFHKHLDRHERNGEPDGGDLPWVVEHEGKRWVIDGHHRFVKAQDRGMQTLPAHVMRPFQHEAKLPKAQKCDYCKQQATKRVLHAEGIAYIPVCERHESRAKDHVGDDYCNTKPIPKTASAGSPDHQHGYEHGLLGARGNLPFIERTQARGRELDPEDHDYLAGHAAGTQEKQRRDQHRAETGDYKCPQCSGTGMGVWRNGSQCNECQGSGSISQEAAHKTDTLYHVTDNPHFAPNAHHVPEDNTIAIENRSRPGLYAAHKDGVEHWTRGEGYVRPYVAEIHVPHHAHEPGRWGGERFIPAEHFDKVKVGRVIPLSAHGTNYRGPDARDMTPEQHAVHKQHALDTLRDEHDFGSEDLDHLRRVWAAATSPILDHLCTEGTPAHRLASMAGDPDQLMPHQAAVYRAQSAMTASGKNLYHYLDHGHAQDMCRAVLTEQGHPHGDKVLTTHSNPGKSYVKYDSDSGWPRIGLAPNHLHSHAVFHELAHVLTNGDHESTSDEEAHGPAFVHTFRHLLDSYDSSAARQVFDEHYRPPGEEHASHLASTSATLYHWAPKAARDDIAEHGLDHRRAPGFDPAGQGPRGVFMHHSEALARDWVPGIERTHDLYEVRASGLKLHPDPYDTGDASYSEHPVPPDRLRRIATRSTQVWITPQLVMGSAAGLNHARAVHSVSEAQSAISNGLTAVLPAGSWFIARQALQALGMSLLDVTQRLRQLGAPISVTGQQVSATADPAVQQAQRLTRNVNPALQRPFADESEASGVLQRVLHHLGHPRADEAFVIRHERPEQNRSQVVYDDATGAPGVALHPDRWDRSGLAHEVGHLMHINSGDVDHSGRIDDSLMHGREFQEHHRRALEVLDPKAGRDYGRILGLR